MSDSQSKQLKHPLVLGLLLVAGLFLYNSVRTGSLDEVSTSEQETVDGKKKKKKPLPDFLTRSPVLLPGVFDKRVGETDQADLKAEDPNESEFDIACLLYTSPSPRDQRGSRMPSSA